MTDQTRQGNLFDQRTAPYVRESDTSRAAAKSIEPHAGTLRAKVRDFVILRGARGATCDEIEEALGLRHQTCSARCKELRDGAHLVDSGNRRITRSGRYAAVLVKPDLHAQVS